MASAVLVLAVVHLFTPYTALGLEGQPVAAGGNSRYLLPALLVAAPLGAWLAGRHRRARVVVEAVALAAIVVGLVVGFELPAATVVAAALATAALAAVAFAARGLAGRRAGLALGLAAVVALAALGHERQRVYNEGRYAGREPAIDWILERAPRDQRIGLAGVWDDRGLVPVLPAFGPRLRNEVEYVGEYRRGLLHEYDERGPFLAAVARARYDLLLVGRDDYPRQCRLPGARRLEDEWALSAGFERVAESPRLTLYRVPDGAGARPRRG
jgi:hypothetical protein